MPNLPPTLPRKQVAELLGTSVRSILRLDEAGTLHPIRDADGNITYSGTEVEALMKARGLAPRAPRAARVQPSEGALTALVLNDLRADRDMVDIMIEHELTTDVADALVAVYEHHSGGIMIHGEWRKRLHARMPKATSAGVLVPAIDYLLDRNIELGRFFYLCAVCGKPVQARSAVEWAYVMKCNAFKTSSHEACKPHDVARK